MPRKPVIEGGKRDEIARAAMKLFFTKGFDGTSVRSIMNLAGGEVGLFYYYFENKDAVFDAVLDLFFDHYQREFAQIVEHGRRNPCRLMEDFFEYMEIKTKEFRERYAPQMHRTVRWAIREHTMEIIEPFLQQIVAIQSEYYGITPAVESNVAALFLTYGVGSSILHEETNNYINQRAEVKRGISLLMGMPLDEQELRIPYPAELSDIEGMQRLLKQNHEKSDEPDKQWTESDLAQRITDREVWVFRYKNEIPAFSIFSKKGSAIELLAVSPEYEEHKLREKLIETIAAQFSIGTELSVMVGKETQTAIAENRPFDNVQFEK
jgi:AcrR family transcriptional regulator